jgi:hypothetical protein
MFEVRLHVKTGVRRIIRRGPSVLMTQKDTVETLEWRKKRLGLDGIKYLQVRSSVAFTHKHDVFLSSIIFIQSSFERDEFGKKTTVKFVIFVLTACRRKEQCTAIPTTHIVSCIVGIASTDNNVCANCSTYAAYSWRNRETPRQNLTYNRTCALQASHIRFDRNQRVSQALKSHMCTFEYGNTYNMLISAVVRTRKRSTRFLGCWRMLS